MEEKKRAFFLTVSQLRLTPHNKKKVKDILTFLSPTLPYCEKVKNILAQLSTQSIVTTSKYGFIQFWHTTL